MRPSSPRARPAPPPHRLTVLVTGAVLAVSLLGPVSGGPAVASPEAPAAPVSPLVPAEVVPPAPVAPAEPVPAPVDEAAAPADEAAALVDEAAALAALEQAESFTEGELAPALRERSRRTSLLGRLLGRPAVPDSSRVDGTQVLTELFRLSQGLRGADQRRADALLARPTDQGADPIGDGYTGASRRVCSAEICVHWAPGGDDAPPNRAWVQRSLSVLNKVWRAEVDRLGFREPLADRGAGGDDRFDVYLKDLGDTGAYGYCTPERRAPGNRFTASGYCVLDNDFSPRQYAGPAGKSLRVTAAHEFFHAVQFSYDFGEDPWFMESTAVWMEEEVMGGINDNRQYLPFGQLADPGSPLDRFDAGSFNQYGNWIWWQHLADRFGTPVVRQVWEAAAAGRGRRDAYSTEAVRRVLAQRGGFPAVFARYAAATTDASRSYGEGRRWPRASTSGSQQLAAGSPRARTSAVVDHMASSSWVYRPDPTLAARSWSLRIKVRGPRAALSPAVAVRISKADGSIVERRVPLSRGGRGSAVVPFGARGVSEVTVTLANASTRFRCWKGSFTASCQGRPRDNDVPFALRVQAFRR